METPEAVVDRADLQIAFDALQAKLNPETVLFQYYDGEQPAVYSGEWLKKVLGGKAKNFSQNWCVVTIDSVLDRLNLAGYAIEDEAIAAAVKTIWDNSEWNLESDSVHEAALVTGEAFLIIWPNKDGSPEAYYNDPRLCHLQYDAQFPRVPLWAAKRWVGDDEYYYMTMYYHDRLEYWRSAKKVKDVTDAKSFVPTEEGQSENIYKQIPVFHFRTQRRHIQGDLANVISLQDAVNILLTDMLATAEYAAAPMRYVIGAGDGELDDLENGPNKIWDIAGAVAGDGKVEVGQFAAADLGNYLAAMDSLAHSIGTITHTPKHYFLGASAGANLSGEALIAMEAPLNKKAADRIEVFGPVWMQAMAFALRIAGHTVDPLTILPKYDEPATVQPRTSAEILGMRVAAGVPLKSALRMEGMDDAEIEAIEQERTDEQSAQQPRRIGLRDVVQPVAQEGDGE